ncbi:hypothetical protein [Amycolatopsis cihanbeyliensis]|uniref:Class 3 adenylate cyclase n=1 Tax=Amycolatopsis cihanbeyliensis TaxID=1128664 RepID=A0A542DQX4_AMYCI|nr:hypothetical protein [Amycolatopsis cihanbeyliensis]TQJ05500.1 hypothetical protein FB471_5335 [Amycolatopsis cihanbeyliensis]
MFPLTSSRYNARSHAVLAVDIVGSSQATDDLLDPMKSEMEHRVAEALCTVGLAWSDARHFRETGDGVMLAYPEQAIGQVVEVVFHLDHLMRSRNRYARTPMRARVAVHCGPMAENHRYHRTYITLTRLLTAGTFTGAVAHWCRLDPVGEKFGAGVVISQQVWRNVVEPFAVALVPPARCAQITAVAADFVDNAWIHFPGLDAEAALADIGVERAAARPSRESATGLDGFVTGPAPPTGCDVVSLAGSPLPGLNGSHAFPVPRQSDEGA